MTTTITTGDLNKHFGVSMTTDFVKELGYRPAETARAGHPRWAIADVPAIGRDLADHIIDRCSADVVVSPPAAKKAKAAPAAAPTTTDDDDL